MRRNRNQRGQSSSTEDARLSASELLWFRGRLSAWFEREKRDLPWRRTSDPYRIWISEAMLQQTRVEAVLDHYRAFLERFADVYALAQAGEEEVLAAWSGLGYYRRARALHRAAQEIVELHDGEFPRDRAKALSLPGVGPYTAGAVLSIAHDAPEPLVDGNVTRVFARLFGLEAPVGSTELTRASWDLASELVPNPSLGEEPGPGTWNQALMELGALVCTPKSPACERCPLAERCVARRSGRSETLPCPAPKRAKLDVRLEVLLVRSAGATLFHQRPGDGRMAGLWELPTREVVPAGGTRRLWPELWPELPAGVQFDSGKELGGLTHAITNHRIRAVVFAGRVPGSSTEEAGLEPDCTRLRWCSNAEAAELPLTGMTRKILARW